MSRVSWHLKAYSIVEGEMTDRGTTEPQITRQTSLLRSIHLWRERCIAGTDSIYLHETWSEAG